MIKINNEIKNALNVIGYHSFTPIQEQVIPFLLENKNVVVKSKTGSGKTASFAIPICEHIDWKENKPQALILACTRELVQQIKEEVSNIGKLKKIKVSAIYGKEKMAYQVDALKQKCHIVVSTPGRLLDHLQNHSIDLSEVKYFIIDEADYMMDMGFIEQVEEIISYLNKEVVKGLFSATYPKRILSLIDEYMGNYEMVEMDEQNQIDHYYIKTNAVFDSLVNELSQTQIESALIFCDMQKDVDELFHQLDAIGIKSVKIHGGLRQEERFKSLKAFREGKRRILIATDVASRGIDIEKVSHVYHYSIPHSIEEYTHRSGRSGRINEKGCSILFVNEENDLVKQLIETFSIKEKQITINTNKNFYHLNSTVQKDKMESKWNASITKLYIGAGKEKKVRAGDIIGALCSLDGITSDDIGVIEVLQKMSYVEILNDKAPYIVECFKNKTIKNKKVRVEIAS